MGEEFLHEGLDCYKLAVQVSRWAAMQVFPGHRKHLRDQLVRAADSIVLNIAEGAGRGPGDSRRNQYRIALGSAAEARDDRINPRAGRSQYPRSEFHDPKLNW
jgi:hypothetical protein